MVAAGFSLRLFKKTQALACDYLKKRRLKPAATMIKNIYIRRKR